MSPSYYQPSLSEFQVGFTYEYVEGDFLVTKTFNEFSNLLNTQQLLDEGSLRVKCLDEDDLLAYGFVGEENPNTNDGSLDIIGEQYFTHPGFGYELILRRGQATAFIILRPIAFTFALPMYSGECRNAHELAWLLIRLGIHSPTVYESS